MWACVLRPHLYLAYDGEHRQFADVSGDQRIVHSSNKYLLAPSNLLVAKDKMKKAIMLSVLKEFLFQLKEKKEMHTRSI